MIVSKVSYEVTDPTVDSQMISLKNSGADTFFNITTPKFAAQAIKKAAEIGWKPTHYLNNVSAQVGATLKPAGLENSVGIITTQYGKDPTDPQWANDEGMKLYKTVIANCATCKPEDGFNLYGVAVAYTMVDVLKQAGSNMTRANVMKIASSQLNETNPFALPGVKIQTTSSDHFPIMQEQVITWAGTGWKLQGSLIDERGTIK